MNEPRASTSGSACVDEADPDPDGVCVDELLLQVRPTDHMEISNSTRVRPRADGNFMLRITPARQL